MIKPQQPQGRMGWIAPTGEYFPCGYGCHQYLSELLFDQFYDYEETNYVSDLIQLGWIKFHGYNIQYKLKLTSEQKSTIHKICDAVFDLDKPGFNWKEYYYANPEMYKDTSLIVNCDGIDIPKGSVYKFLSQNIQNKLHEEPLSKRINAHPGD